MFRPMASARIPCIVNISPRSSKFDSRLIHAFELRIWNAVSGCVWKYVGDTEVIVVGSYECKSDDIRVHICCHYRFVCNAGRSGEATHLLRRLINSKHLGMTVSPLRASTSPSPLPAPLQQPINGSVSPVSLLLLVWQRLPCRATYGSLVHFNNKVADRTWN